MTSDTLLFHYERIGNNGRLKLSAVRDGVTLHVDEIVIAKAKSRGDFLRAMMQKSPDIDAIDAERALLGIVAELSEADKPATPQGDPWAELDVTSIIRPERFTHPEVAGLAVPLMTTRDNKPVGRWQLYLRWADGRRERCNMPPFVELPEGRRLWIHPDPAEPTPSTPARWSPSSRKRWLEGAPAPDPGDVFRRLCERIAYYIDLPTERAPGTTATLALWSMLSYFSGCFDAVPYLFVGGPLGSGKSRVFEILSRLVFRPLGSSNMTGPALFRTLHSMGGVLLLDEAERLKQTQDPGTQEILSMLLAGYKKGGQATRLEPMGDTFRTVSFDVFGLKALACIAGLPAALSSRCISITMFRAGRGSEKPKRRIDADPAAWRQLRDDLHALALEHGPTWLELPSRDVCHGMSGRDFELWQPILSIASWLQDCGAQGLLPLLQAHAQECIDAGRDDQIGDADETLLRLLADRRLNLEQPTPGEILKAAAEAEPSTFRLWTPKGVANALKRYGVATATIHGRRVYSRVGLDDLRKIENTYGLTLGLPECENKTGVGTPE